MTFGTTWKTEPPY